MNTDSQRAKRSHRATGKPSGRPLKHPASLVVVQTATRVRKHMSVEDWLTLALYAQQRAAAQLVARNPHPLAEAAWQEARAELRVLQGLNPAHTSAVAEVRAHIGYTVEALVVSGITPSAEPPVWNPEADEPDSPSYNPASDLTAEARAGTALTEVWP